MSESSEGARQVCQTSAPHSDSSEQYTGYCGGSVTQTGFMYGVQLVPSGQSSSDWHMKDRVEKQPNPCVVFPQPFSSL